MREVRRYLKIRDRNGPYDRNFEFDLVHSFEQIRQNEIIYALIS